MIEALNIAMALPRQSLSAMGARGRDWMQRDYSWDRIGQDMLSAYAWAVRGGTPPETVRL